MQGSLLEDVEAFLRAHGMADSTFGREALGDWRLVAELRGENRDRPRRLWPETEAKVRRFMATYAPDRADAA